MKRRTTPRHYKADKFDTKREVLSYEQLPLDEYEADAEKDKRKKSDKSVSPYKRLIIVGAVLVLLVVAVFVVFNRFACVGCSQVTYDSSGFPVPLKGSVVADGNFKSFNGGFAYASDTNYVVCSDNGSEKLSAQISYNKPVLEMNRNGNAIVYDLGSDNFSIFSDSALMYSGKTENTMYLADVTDNFSYGVVTENRDYKAKLSVYDSEHNPLYGYSFEEYYITAMHLKDDATGAVVCGITAENGIEKSAVYVFDFTQEKPLAFYEMKNEVVYDCDYLNGSSVCVVGENASYILSGWNFDKLTKNSYSQMTLTSYDINSDIGQLAVALSRSGDGRNCTVQCIGTAGNVEHTIDTDFTADYISTYKNRVAISNSDVCLLYSDLGEKLSECELNSDSRQIKLKAADTILALSLKDIAVHIF